MAAIKIAILGAGYMAREHIKAFKNLPDISVSGIFSRTKEKSEILAKEFNIEFVCDSISELYEKTRADLVIIAVSVLKTKEVVFEALQYPWVQLIEKPLGCNVMEAEEIVTAFQISSTKGFTAFNRRFYSSTQRVLKELKGSKNEKKIICIYDQEDPNAKWEEPRERKLIDNWMYVNPIHLIDYFRVLGNGDIVSVKPIVRWNPDNPFLVVSQLEYASGDIGIYQAVWGAPGPWAVTITKKEKRWELRPLEDLSIQLYGSRNVENIPMDQNDIDFKAGLRLQAREVVKALKGEPNSLVTLSDALETMKLVEQIYK